MLSVIDGTCRFQPENHSLLIELLNTEMITIPASIIICGHFPGSNNENVFVVSNFLFEMMKGRMQHLIAL